MLFSSSSCIDGTFSFWLDFVNGEEVDDKKEDDEKVRFSGFEIMKIEELVSFFLKLFYRNKFNCNISLH